MRIYVVEDQPEVAETLGELLEVLGHEVRIAYHGKQILAGAAEFRPEAVICDIGLPDLDGFEVFQRLRELPETRDTPVIALTGYTDPEFRRRAEVLGFQEYLVKPVDGDYLDRLLGGLKVEG